MNGAVATPRQIVEDTLFPSQMAIQLSGLANMRCFGAGLTSALPG